MKIEELTFSSLFYLNQLQKDDFFYRWCINGAPLHHHLDFIEITFIAEGSYLNAINGVQFVASEQSLLITNANIIHKLDALTPKNRHFTVCMPASIFDNIAKVCFDQTPFLLQNQYLYRLLNGNEFSFLNTLISQIKNQSSNKSIIKLFVLNALFFIQQKSIFSSGGLEASVKSIMNGIDNYTYLSTPISEIYKKYPYSSTALITQFKKITGKTIVQYQLDIKLKYSAQLLQETDYSIEKIVEALGIFSCSYYYKKFKNKFGVSPNQYRVNAKKQITQSTSILADKIYHK